MSKINTSEARKVGEIWFTYVNATYANMLLPFWMSINGNYRVCVMEVPQEPDETLDDQKPQRIWVVTLYKTHQMPDAFNILAESNVFTDQNEAFNLAAEWANESPYRMQGELKFIWHRGGSQQQQRRGLPRPELRNYWECNDLKRSIIFKHGNEWIVQEYEQGLTPGMHKHNQSRIYTNERKAWRCAELIALGYEKTSLPPAQ